MNMINPQFLEALAWTLIHFLWQGLVIGVVAALALRSLKKNKPQTRYTVALIAFAICALAPVATFAFLWSQFSGISYDLIAGASALQSGDVHTWAQDYPQWFVKILPDIPNFLVAGWLAGVLLGGIKLFFGFLGVQWVRRHAVEPIPARLQALFDELCVEFELQGRVALKISNQILSPMTVGWLRPLVLVPASAWLGLRQDELRLILAHELAHIRRWDYLVNICQQVAVTILFYHPVVHWLSRVLSEEREMCCDELVVGESEDTRLAYAKALLHLQEQHGHMMTLVMSARGGAFLRRIYSLLGKDERKEGPQATVNGLVSLMVVGVVNVVFMLHSNDAVANFVGLNALQPEPKIIQLPLRRGPLDHVLSDVRNSWETAVEREALGPAIEVPGVAEVAKRLEVLESQRQQNQVASGQSSEQSSQGLAVPSFNIAAAQAMAREALKQQVAQVDVVKELSIDPKPAFDTQPARQLASLNFKPAAKQVALEVPASKARSSEPRLVRMVQPHFPLSARFRSAAGDVRLVYQLHPDGSIRNIQHDTSSESHPALVKAAIEALEAWEYEPFDSDRPLVMAQTFRFVGKSERNRADDICFSRIKEVCGRGLEPADRITVNTDLAGQG
ncbi:MAG: M56 family metallopeptidase [Xanthomonadales bacterium]|nr:M56 family metallopeptidase [Xanthomonadales bacterium]